MKLTLLAAGCALSGCAVVNVHTHGKEGITVTRGFGSINVTAHPALGPVMLEARSVGFSQVQGSAVLGYRSDMLVSLPPDACRVVFWIETLAAAEAVRKLLADAGPDVCSVDFSTRKGKQ